MRTGVYIVTRPPGGFVERQLARATPKYRTTSWYDFLAFRCESDDAGTPERYGQVRTLLSMEDGDVAVVAELVPTGEDDGPLTSRRCTHLRWAWQPTASSGGEDGTVRWLCVPVKNWRRVVHIVPDFADLLRRRGVGATPAELGGPGRDLREQRFLLNVFCLSSGVRLREEEGESGGF